MSFSNGKVGVPNADDRNFEDEIRTRRYRIGEQEGRPNGKHIDHWLRAEAEVRSDRRDRMRNGELLVDFEAAYFGDHFG